jgi:hypothetical protein
MPIKTREARGEEESAGQAMGERHARSLTARRQAPRARAV